MKDKPIWYKLIGHQPVADETNGMWLATAGKEKRRVAFTEVVKGVEVSTVFLCLDHNFGDSDQPVLFETLVLAEI